MQPWRKSIFTNPIHFLAGGLGSGAIPFAPGTWGTVVGWIFYILLMPLFEYDLQTHLLFALFIVVTFIIGIYLCDKTSKNWGVHDHGAIVWDEMVGIWLTFLALPFNWYLAIAGFILFRFFDIIKPWPIKWLDSKVKGGFGIMIDDVLAAVFANLCLWPIYLYCL